MINRIQTFFRSPRNSILTAGVLILLIASFIFRTDTPHVSLAAEPLLENGPKWFTNSLLTTLVVDVIIILLAIWTRLSLKEVPQGFGNFMEFVIEALYNLTQSVAGKQARKFFPIVATIFLFVIISNYSGLIPGVGSINVYHSAGAHNGEEHKGEGEDHGSLVGEPLAALQGSVLFASPAAEEGGYKAVPLFRAPSADLNMTFALALVVMVLVQVWGVQALGGRYFKKFFNFSGGGMGIIMGLAGILELISEVAKVISFAFRLFGNIFAGEVLLAVMAFLITFLIPIPFYGLELFVGFIQALVFMMLAVVFFTTATVSHDDHH